MAEHLLVTPTGTLLGAREGAPSPRVFLARDEEEAEEWESALLQERAPRIETTGFAITETGMRILEGELERSGPALGDWQRALAPPGYRLGPRGMRFLRCATDFRAFLDVWSFLDQDTGVPRLLGETLWPGQERFAAAAAEHPWTYFLKNRQIGYTTIAVAYDAWVLRFRTANARVHLVSRTETLAKSSLLKPLKYGIARLPKELQLPLLRDTTTLLELAAGVDDRRLAQAYDGRRSLGPRRRRPRCRPGRRLALRRRTHERARESGRGTPRPHGAKTRAAGCSGRAPRWRTDVA